MTSKFDSNVKRQRSPYVCKKVPGPKPGLPKCPVDLPEHINFILAFQHQNGPHRAIVSGSVLALNLHDGTFFGSGPGQGEFNGLIQPCTVSCFMLWGLPGCQYNINAAFVGPTIFDAANIDTIQTYSGGLPLFLSTGTLQTTDLLGSGSAHGHAAG